MMQPTGWILIAGPLLVQSALFTLSAGASERQQAEAFVKRYCVDCHHSADPAGQRAFDTLDWTSAQPELQLRLQEVIDQLTLGAMPPADADIPTASERQEGVTALTSVLAALREQHPVRGPRSVLRRLSRREYRNTVGSLLGIDMTLFDPTVEFPTDNLSQQSDNYGEALVTSGHLLEKYLEAADRCVEKALAPIPGTEPREWVFADGFLQQQELNRAHKLAFDHRYLVLYDHPLNDKPEGAYGHLARFASGVPTDGVYEVRVLAEALHRDTRYNQRTV
ncbi:MAG: DUF1587 domain-containing protein, partial [Pirellulaceae bacterium]